MFQAQVLDVLDLPYTRGGEVFKANPECGIQKVKGKRKATQVKLHFSYDNICPTNCCIKLVIDVDIDLFMRNLTYQGS